MVADNNDKSGDLSSLMSMPEEGHQAPAPVTPEQPPEPVEFESLEELTHSQEQNAASDAPTATATSADTSSSEVPPMSFESLADMPQTEAPPAEPAPADPLTSDPLPMEGMNIHADLNAPLDASMDPPVSSPTGAMDTIKHYSETLSTPSQVSASFPFTLKIDGMLSPEDAEKLITVLTRENMGFREVDLEPQLSSGRILIPRISEYAGIVLIQALRGIPAKIYFGPADEIFSTPETRDDTPHLQGDAVTTWSTQDETQSKHAEHLSVENMPVTNLDHIPQFTRFEILDTIFTSGLLSTNSVEALLSNEYERLLEGLLRELKFKAHRRGANGIVSLNVQLTPLTLPTDYRVTITGSAVKSH